MSVRDRIKMLIEILREEDLDEIEVRGWFSGIRVARRRSGEAAPAAVEAEAEAAPVREPEPVEEAAPAETETQEDTADAGFEEFLSPMVGTFFRSAGPGKDPFIIEGSREAENGGVIRKILVEDAQPVEFGQPLFLVESA
jgi:acetyl-CoA carboxylase biotin carboxyl carrier protein